MRNHRLVLAPIAVIGAFSLAACSAPGSGSSSVERQTIEEITEQITPEQVAALGDITLDVLADAGEELTMKDFIPEFEALYPNVTVDIEYRSYDDIIKTEANSLNGNNPPDLAQGAQGYALDSVLVGADLLRPLDDLAEVYDWSGRFGDETLSEFRWNDDGSQFGTGSIYGIAPVVSMVGVYYNKTKLAALGLDAPESYAEFAEYLQIAQDGGEQPIMLGNANKVPGLNVAALLTGQTGDPADIRAWIGGEPGTTFVTESNTDMALTIQDWANRGYFGEGFNGIAEDDAVGRFAQGTGLFLVGGTWQMSAISKGDQEIGFFAMPPGVTGKYVAPGSLGMGWHISAASDQQLAAAAWIALITSDEWAQKLADIGRVPVLTDGVTSEDPLFQNAIEGSANSLADGGSTYMFDWATGTMMNTAGGGLQELMDNRTTPEEFLETVQADWQAFQDKK